MIPLMKNAFLNEYETKKALSDFIMKADRLSMDAKCAEFEEVFSKKQDRIIAFAVQSLPANFYIPDPIAIG